MRKALIVFLGVMFVVALSVSAQAIPTLGVIGVDLLPDYDGMGHSFAYPSDGELYVWYGSDSGTAPPAHIWLATTAGSEYTFTTVGGIFDLDDDLTDKVDGYPWAEPGVQAYMAVLGTFDSDTPVDWVSADYLVGLGLLPDDHIMVTGEKDFWLLEGTFSGDLPVGEWIFAMADIQGNEMLFNTGSDRFSPKTTSTVPEPGTLLLLGSALAGLALFGRRKSRRS